MKCPRYYPDGSTVSVCLSNVRYACIGDPVTDATGRVSLLAADESVISGPHATSADGAGGYRAIIPAEDLSLYSNIYLEIILEKGTEFTTRILQPMQVRTRLIC